MNRFRAFILTSAAFSLGLALGGLPADATPENQNPYQVVGQLGRVLVQVENHYVDPVERNKLLEGAIKGMVENRSERLMVGSTIALAHSLDRRVVAEGVETRETLELLAEMECDLAQGFVTGRPMSFESLRRRLASDRRSRAA